MSLNIDTAKRIEAQSWIQCMPGGQSTTSIKHPYHKGFVLVVVGNLWVDTLHGESNILA